VKIIVNWVSQGYDTIFEYSFLAILFVKLNTVLFAVAGYVFIRLMHR
jgi:uncharacterized membrane protein